MKNLKILTLNHYFKKKIEFKRTFKIIQFNRIINHYKLINKINFIINLKKLKYCKFSL
jgi:hypothetical protein